GRRRSCRWRRPWWEWSWWGRRSSSLLLRVPTGESLLRGVGEELLDLVEPALPLRRDVLLLQLGQLAQQLLLPPGRLPRRLDDDLHVQVAAPPAAHVRVRHALPGDGHDVVTLDAARQGLRDALAVHGRDLDRA